MIVLSIGLDCLMVSVGGFLVCCFARWVFWFSVTVVGRCWLDGFDFGVWLTYWCGVVCSLLLLAR